MSIEEGEGTEEQEKERRELEPQCHLHSDVPHDHPFPATGAATCHFSLAMEP
ncbi:hypothetical protein CC1G_15517 [Coprinopsis cinerea okayama7|uniref:Uncharacterized protein n=1 Tax=Coprinopsis cinerea (strain Okayama-7 / 130 / ATCC MYA-4618 / FGSC 9003) TaxID=240176 RepID=D6RN98_COPC7|nr:hypothetical protein CC1G_15517 [Coprinopsis cinerea okayama7\|eukprot:XP_002910976.1 hypothetical protein CC1G_15517 [Coprinopsis cinerea okayama7\